MKVFAFYMSIVLGIGFIGTTNAATFNSAHLCQVVGSSSQVAYHSAGVLIALRNNVRISCPVTVNFFRDNMSARVYFNSRGSSVTAANLITCKLNKIASNDRTSTGSPRGAGIRVIESLTLNNNVRLPNMIAANISCTLQRNTKILGYQIF